MQPHPQNPYMPMAGGGGPAMGVNTMRPAPSTRPPLRDENKIFVGGIHIAVEEPELKDFFQQYDQVLDVSLMRDHATGRSRGFGFVTFATTEGVAKTVAEKFIEYQGRRMEIKPAVPKGRQAPQPSAGAMGFNPAAAAGMDPAQYAAMSEYYKSAYAMQAAQAAQAGQAAAGANPVLAAMTAAGYTDPKAYLDAMVQAYTQSYGPEMAAQVAAYYAPYLNIPAAEGAAASPASTSEDKHRSSRSRSRSSSPPARTRSRSRSRSPARDRYARRDSRDSRSRHGRSRDDSRERDRGGRYSRYRSRSRSGSRSPLPPPPPPPRDRSVSPTDDRRSYSSRRH
jgi:RNA recognition motif-containing protein